MYPNAITTFEMRSIGLLVYKIPPVPQAGVYICLKRTTIEGLLAIKWLEKFNSTTNLDIHRIPCYAIAYDDQYTIPLYLGQANDLKMKIDLAPGVVWYVLLGKAVLHYRPVK